MIVFACHFDVRGASGCGHVARLILLYSTVAVKQIWSLSKLSYRNKRFIKHAKKDVFHVYVEGIIL